MKTEITKYNPCNDAVEFRNKYNTFQEAWKNCWRGDWMLWLAGELKVPLKPLTLAKALCSKTIIHLMKDERSKKAVEVAEKYGRGKATRKQLDAAAADAYVADAAAYASAYAAADVYAADAAAYAAASAYAAAYASVYAAASAADASAYVAADAADASAYAAYAAADAYAAEKDNQLQTANICREVLTEIIYKKLKI